MQLICTCEHTQEKQVVEHPKSSNGSSSSDASGGNKGDKKGKESNDVTSSGGDGGGKKKEKDDKTEKDFMMKATSRLQLQEVELLSVFSLVNRATRYVCILFVCEDMRVSVCVCMYVCIFSCV